MNLKLLIDCWWLPTAIREDPVAARDALAVRSLAEAVAELSKQLGADMSQWQYGQERYKHVRILHPLSASVTAGLRAKLDAGPLPAADTGQP